MQYGPYPNIKNNEGELLAVLAFAIVMGSVFSPVLCYTTPSIVWTNMCSNFEVGKVGGAHNPLSPLHHNSPRDPNFRDCNHRDVQMLQRCCAEHGRYRRALRMWHGTNGHWPLRRWKIPHSTLTIVWHMDDHRCYRKPLTRQNATTSIVIRPRTVQTTWAHVSLVSLASNCRPVDPPLFPDVQTSQGIYIFLIMPLPS